jgi:hypothetical protein
MALIRQLVQFTIACLLVTGIPGDCHAQKRKLFVAAMTGGEIPAVPLVVVDSVSPADEDPAFHPGLPLMFYLKERDRGSEVMSFDYQTSESRSIALLPFHAKSLCVLPDGSAVSFLSKDMNGKSEFMKYSLKDSSISTIAGNINWENYYWMDDNNLIVIEEGKPNQLSLFTLRPRRQIAIAQHVGKALAYSKKTGSFAFVHKLSVDTWTIKLINSDGSVTILAPTLPEAEVLTLAPDGTPFTIYEGQIRFLSGSRWRNVPELPAGGSLKRIRINVSGEIMAILVVPDN